MRMFRYLTLAALVMLAFSSALAIDVQTDYDRHANFSRYRTYQWDRVQTSNPLWQDRIKKLSITISKPKAGSASTLAVILP